MCFRSKIDAWLMLVMLGASMACAAGLLPLLWAGRGAGALVPLLIGLGGVVLPLWVLLDTRYTVRDGLLLIRSGPFRWRIATGSITGVRPTRSALSSPALSLDRLRIDHGGGRQTVLVSPADRAGFVRALQLPPGVVQGLDASSV